MEHKRGIVKTLMHRVDIILSDVRDKVEEKLHVKQALNISTWLLRLAITGLPMTQPSYESTTSVLSKDTSGDGQDTVKDTTTKKPTSKKSPVVLAYIKGVSEHIRSVQAM